MENFNISISKIIIHFVFIMSMLITYFQYQQLETGATTIYCNNLLQTNAFIILIQTLVYITAYLVMVVYIDEISKTTYRWLKLNTYDFLTIIFTNLVGLWIVIGSNDLITLYLGIELQTFGAFILVALRKTSEYSIESALKYFVLGAVSSAILLLGIGLVYVSLGTTNYTNLASLIQHINDEQTQFTLQVAYVFIMVSLLFKLGAAPFHNWVPDVYQGSTTIVTTYFVSVPKIGLISALIILLVHNIAVISNIWYQTLIICSILSMIVGTAGAVNQYNIKRLLAYSAISHTGYLIIGVLTNSLDGVISIVIYLILYIIMSLITWPLLLNLAQKQSLNSSLSTGDTLESSIIIDNNEYHKTTQYELKGLGRSNPVFAIIFAITLLSIAGIPPLAGFYTKWLLFSAAVDSGYSIIALIGIVTSVIGAIYYLRLIHFMYFRTPDSKFNELSDIVGGLIPMKLSTSLIISIGLLILLIFIFIPQILIDLVTIAVLSVL
uniref:NADH dehydrogenase subunit 2 n=1 Tax=Capsaspora owczarzaki TaxID=192875 RepID=M1K3D4_9EUKA|nr:NADH dehydrogenase subunit 2 [Capsaspora owczarzaki]